MVAGRVLSIALASLMFSPILLFLAPSQEIISEVASAPSFPDNPLDSALEMILDDPLLAREYAPMSGALGDQIRIIVQFKDSLDEELVESFGLQVHSRTTIVESLFVEGTPEQIRSLAEHDSIAWIEWNAPRELLMDSTVDVISARQAWDRAPLRADGGYDLNTEGPKGEGVSVVILDSGIDASHPDMNYAPQQVSTPTSPSEGDKVIYNAKLDQGSGSNTPDFAWIELENTDTTSGHGTHVAGTVAGNGEASAGKFRGVAPEAWLVGLSMGEAAFTIDEYSALEYAYELSQTGSPTQELWNIRVVSNSWGPGFPFDSADPNDMTVQIIEKLSRDNNVVIVFANGNDGGEGGDDQSNIFAKVPSVIGVAAAAHNGVGMSTFSSRGDSTDITTWPDIAAPGVDIWSAAARATMIGGADGVGDVGNGEFDHYYLAISGTSMAAPHIAGVAALMLQVAPNLHMSDIDEDLAEEGNPILQDPSGISPPQEASRLIHEVEAIMKLTADYIIIGDNLAASSSIGIGDKSLDYAQGYGLVNTSRAVALAHSLQMMRDPDGDGKLNHPEITVWDAHKVYENSMGERDIVQSGDYLKATWDGEFAIFSSDVDIPPASAHRRAVFVSAGTTRVEVNLDYSPLPTSLLCPTASNLRLALDMDGDGTYEILDANGEEYLFQGGTTTDTWWYYDIQGNAAGNCFSTNPSTGGPRTPYTVVHKGYLQPGDYHLQIEEYRGMTVEGVDSSSITHQRPVLQHPDYIPPVEKLGGLAGAFEWMKDNWWVPLLVALLITVSMVLSNEKARSYLILSKDKEHAAIYDPNDLEVDEIFEAELIMPELPPTPKSGGGLLSKAIAEEITETEVIEE
jgi:serine protease AprX